MCVCVCVRESEFSTQREVERLERQRREREQVALSQAHYTSCLLRGRGVGPWLRFMETMRRERRRARQFHNHWRSEDTH